MQRCMGCMKEFGKEYDVCPHCGYIVGTKPQFKDHLPAGTIISNRYILGKVLGFGGFGITYIAWDTNLDRVTAIKEFFPHSFLTRTEGTAEVCCYDNKSESFFREGVKKTHDESIRISKFSANNNIVNIYDCFEENNTAYIVMEYLEGRDLKEYLAENKGILKPDEAVKIICSVLNALEDMHKVKLIHRDIAPDNIYICDNGNVKLLDFGSARLAIEDATKSLSVMVKRGFAPQEQYLSRSKQGPWTDIYAVCATLYKLITGVTPPDSNEREFEEMKSFSDLGIKGCEKLEQVILRGMEPDYTKRIRNVTQLREELNAAVKPAADNTAPAAPTAPKPVLPLQPESPNPPMDKKNIHDNTGSPASGSKKKIAVIAIISAVVIAVVAAVVLIIKPWNTSQSAEVEQESLQIAATEDSATTGSHEPDTSATQVTEAETDPLLNAAVGDYITFGSYEQDNKTANGKEDIEWQVLDKQDDRILVISRYVLDAKPYHEENESITWENCTLRSWLNDDFLNTAFSEEEQSRIPTVTVKAEKHPDLNTDLGNDTEDKIFLLSYSEAEEYFASGDERMCKPTAYAESEVLGVISEYGTCGWWLRTPSNDSSIACHVNNNGNVNNYYYVNFYNGIRPVLWINLNS